MSRGVVYEDEKTKSAEEDEKRPNAPRCAQMRPSAPKKTRNDEWKNIVQICFDR